jgi:hypothetical protein
MKPPGPCLPAPLLDRLPLQPDLAVAFRHEEVVRLDETHVRITRDDLTTSADSTIGCTFANAPESFALNMSRSSRGT